MTWPFGRIPTLRQTMIQQLGPQDASLFWHILMSLGPFRSFHPRDMMFHMNSRMCQQYADPICSHLGLAPWLWWRAPHSRIRRATTGSTAFPSAGAKGRSSQVHPKLSADAPSLHTLYCLISNIIHILHI